MSVKIYEVGKAIQGHTKYKGKDFKELAKRHEAILKGKRFQAAFPKYAASQVRLELGNGSGSYSYIRQRLIRLGANRDEYVLLHEMAHHIAVQQYGDTGSHGVEYATALLAVVKVVLGSAAATDLKYAYAALGIKVLGSNGKPRKVSKPAGVSAELVDHYAKVSGEARQRVWIRKVVKQIEAGQQPEMDCPKCDGIIRLEVDYIDRYRKHWRVVVRGTCACGHWEGESFLMGYGFLPEIRKVKNGN